MTGLLIVNADDFGFNVQATDAALSCFFIGSVTSLSAMVHMRDSARAAGAARDRDAAPGLHLNLTQLFDDPDTPPAVLERQASLVRYFRASPWAHWVFNPLVHRRVEATVADQLRAFGELYGQAPTHVDGHQHIQECPNVVLSRSLSAELRLRRSYTYAPGERSFAKRAVRAALSAAICHRFRTTRYFFDIRYLHPMLGGTGLEGRLALADHASVELMVHPAVPDEYEMLTNPEWRERTGAHPLGSWTDL